MTPEALHRAYGVALASLEGLLIHQGVLELGELSHTLASMALDAPSDDREAAEALEAWAAMLQQVDADHTGEMQ